jgi:type I restriction enzyme S subunit
MELKPGYKQTQVGVIPEDWEVRPFLSVVKPATGQVSPKQDPYKSMILVAPDHIEGETGRLLVKRTASAQGAISGKYLFRPGDIVYSKIRPYLRKAILADFQGLCSADMYPLTPAKDVCSAFVLAALLGHRFSTFTSTVSARSGIPKINREELAQYTFALPPLPEQCAIAAALSDVDALIGALEEQIVKRRDLKQAAMQQLLTGARRLPGFGDEWKVKRFGDLFQFLKTANNPRADLSTHGTVGYIHYGDIHTTTSAFLNCTDWSLPYIPNERIGDIPFLEDGDLVMADASEDYEGIGKCVELRNTGSRKIVAGLHTFLLRGRKDLLADGFKGYLQFIPSVKAALIRFATGISVYGVSKNNVRNVEIELPAVDEQRAITTMLFDLDAEIAALEQRRDKTRLLKEGLIQELLMGRTRLV